MRAEENDEEKKETRLGGSGCRFGREDDSTERFTWLEQAFFASFFFPLSTFYSLYVVSGEESLEEYVWKEGVISVSLFRNVCSYTFVGCIFHKNFSFGTQYIFRF